MKITEIIIEGVAEATEWHGSDTDRSWYDEYKNDPVRVKVKNTSGMGGQPAGTYTVRSFTKVAPNNAEFTVNSQGREMTASLDLDKPKTYIDKNYDKQYAYDFYSGRMPITPRQAFNLIQVKKKPDNSQLGVAEQDVAEAAPITQGSKITWFHSTQFPAVEGTVIGEKDGKYIVQAVDPSPRNTAKSVTKYLVGKNNIVSQGVAEGLSERDQKDVEAIKAAIERLESQLKQPNVDKSEIQSRISQETKRLALYKQGVAEGFGEIKIPTDDNITMQDIRLIAGEGKLTRKTVLQAIDIIRKQRRPQGVDEAAKKGLYYNVNKRKAAGTSRDADSPKAPTAQAWKDAAKTAKNEGVAENMDHSKDDQAVPELKAALLAKKQKLQSATDDQVYDTINSIMTRIAKSHGMSGQKLHDMWVKKYTQIPDTWIMK